MSYWSISCATFCKRKRVDESVAQDGEGRTLRPTQGIFRNPSRRDRGPKLNALTSVLRCWERHLAQRSAKACRVLSKRSGSSGGICKKDDAASDLALIGAAQRVEHYEISGYTTARNLAQQLRHSGMVSLLSKSLGQKKKTRISCSISDRTERLAKIEVADRAAYSAAASLVGLPATSLIADIT